MISIIKTLFPKVLNNIKKLGIKWYYGKIKVEIDKEACIGCGACTTCDNFEMGDDGKAAAKKTELEEVGCSKEAAEICPVQAIKLMEME